MSPVDRHKVLLVSVEPCWPPTHGGRLRTSRLAEALAESLDVTVLAPAHGELAQPPSGIRLALQPPPKVNQRGLLAATASSRPRLGNVWMSTLQASLAIKAQSSDVIVWSHDYLAAAASAYTRPEVIDIQNIEIARHQSLADRASGLTRISRRIEQLKATRWEPRVWRRADGLLALCTDDAGFLSGFSANVVLAPVGADRQAYVPSPHNGPVLMVGSFGYEPNRTAAQWLVKDVWPRVVAQFPGRRLILAGRSADEHVGSLASDAVRVVSDFMDSAELYAGAAVVVAPVTAGAGVQLKVVEALAANRVLVATPFSARSAPAAAVEAGLCQVVDGANRFADAIGDLLSDPPSRHRLEEEAAGSRVVPTWRETLEPAVQMVMRVASDRRTLSR